MQRFIRLHPVERNPTHSCLRAIPITHANSECWQKPIEEIETNAPKKHVPLNRETECERLPVSPLVGTQVIQLEVIVSNPTTRDASKHPSATDSSRMCTRLDLQHINPISARIKSAPVDGRGRSERDPRRRAEKRKDRLHLPAHPYISHPVV